MAGYGRCARICPAVVGSTFHPMQCTNIMHVGIVCGSVLKENSRECRPLSGGGTGPACNTSRVVPRLVGSQMFTYVPHTYSRAHPGASKPPLLGSGSGQTGQAAGDNSLDDQPPSGPRARPSHEEGRCGPITQGRRLSLLSKAEACAARPVGSRTSPGTPPDTDPAVCARSHQPCCESA